MSATRLAGCRAVAYVVQPLCASARAVAAPMPDEAPVTSATLFVVDISASVVLDVAVEKQYKRWSVLQSQGAIPMRIRQLAEQTGVIVDTIRFYEKRGLLDQAHFQRSPNGYRAYTARAIERLEMIELAQTAGFALSEIAELFGLWEQNQLGDDLILARLREKQQQIARKIAELAQIQSYVLDKIEQLEQQVPAART